MPFRQTIGIALASCLLFASAAHGAEHACGADAVARAKKLLRFHANAQPDMIGDGTTAKVLAPVRALKGNGLLDVLEVTSHIYKADFRMRFIYARAKDASCTLMGQEILEASNPY